MVGTKKSERILLRAYLPKCPLRLTAQQGFSLIEIAVVMIIIGLIMTAGVTIFRSSILSTKLSTTKTNLDNIKTSVINFAIANGRLPCPDTWVAPPNNTGQSNPLGAGVCVFGAGCPVPPCYVPFQTLQLQLPGGRDSFGNVFRYDISQEIVAGTGLTNTTQDTFCGVLFEYLNHATDTGVPRQPCVTDANDPTPANGQIDPPGQGYSVAALIISQTSIDNVFSAPPGLSGKNVVGVDREYEMATRANDNAYGNLVSELTYGDLYNKICTAQKTKIRIQNNDLSMPPPQRNKCAELNLSGNKILVPAGTFFDLPQGNSVQFYTTDATGTTCQPTTCGTPITFNMTAVATDAGNVDWMGLPFPVVTRNGRVQITTGTCTLGDI